MPAKNKYKIAIDGPAASGKSTTAWRVAQLLGYTYIDSGAMYRALTYCVILEKIDTNDEDRITALARKLDIQINNRDGNLRILVNDRDISEEIRLPQVDEIISKISAYREVRAILVEKQRRIAATGGIVMDGRDIGTVVLPDAEIKIFMQADLKTRARRRYEELIARGLKLDLHDIEKDIRRRDRLDSSRSIGPLKAAADAHIIDTSQLSIAQQVEQVLEIVRLQRKKDSNGQS